MAVPRSVAVMPENMSRERFEWLEKLGAEVLKTPAGGVSELLKAVSGLRNSGEDVMVFNLLHIEDPLALEILEGRFAEGDRILIDRAPAGGLAFSKQ